MDISELTNGKMYEIQIGKFVYSLFCFTMSLVNSLSNFSDPNVMVIRHNKQSQEVLYWDLRDAPQNETEAMEIINQLIKENS